MKKIFISMILMAVLMVTGCSSTKESAQKQEPQNEIEVVTNILETEETEEEVETQEIQETEIHFIDTGNSDSILVKQGDKSALIDGGENGDERTVVSYLKSQGITELEYVFATHPDADHIGGLDAVINSISVKNVFVSNGDADTKTYSDFINAIANKGLSPSVPLLNSEFKLGSSTFKVLSAANRDEPNDNSLVLLYTNGNDKILFTGDAGKEIESQLNVGDVDLLKVGHHGSKTSTSSSFLQNINPEYAVILVGENNRYNHPHSEVMSVLENSNVEVHRTDECGNIVFKSSGDGLSVNCNKGSYDSRDAGSSSGSNTVVEQTHISTPEPEPVVSDNSQSVYWTSGGKKYHSDPTCSRMNNPTSGTISESGRTPCKKCY